MNEILYEEPNILEDYILTYKNREGKLDANENYFFFLYDFTCFKDICSTISRARSKLESLNIPPTCLSISVHPLSGDFIVERLLHSALMQLHF